LFYLYIF